MVLWKLIPVDPLDPDWEASSHRGAVIVRAPTEASARSEAARVFDVSTRFPPGRGVRVPPWKRASLVRAERVEDARYAADGPTEVVEPTV